MSLAFDENGRPFIILREQASKKRVKGLEAHKVSYQEESVHHSLPLIRKLAIKSLQCIASLQVRSFLLSRRLF